MSHYPPYGPPPPPPPYPGYGPPPPPPGAYAYVPMPMMMPYPQAPPPTDTTYVTNYYVQQPPTSVPQTPPVHYPVTTPPSYVEPVRVVEEIIDWVPATPGTALMYSNRAVVGGHEGWDGSPLWVIRAHHSGDLLPGKLAVKHRSAYIPFNGKEVPVHNFEILTAPENAVCWLPANNGQVPATAIVAGNTVKAEPLYVGRARQSFSLTPGKIHPSHRCCYISFGGREMMHKSYEVLCRKE